MKKIRWATHKSLFGQIATSTCLLAVSAGVVFGVSAGTFKVQYFNLNDADARLLAAQTNNYYSQNIKSQWNMYEKLDNTGKVAVPAHAQPTDPDIKSTAGDTWWKSTYKDLPKWCDKEEARGIDPAAMQLNVPSGTKIDSAAQAARKKYGTLVIDGATHVALDRSFNQSLYNGIANFVTNVPHDVNAENEGLIYKPSQDSTQEFVNIYRKAAEATKILCLAGFNHVTPLNALGKQDGALYKFDDANIAKTGMMLIDGDISNNQNVASVLFRSDQPAFLTALSTCMYFYNNLEIYHDHFQDISVAAYGGTAIPTVSIYMGGFQRGIEFFNHFILRKSMLADAASYMEKDDASISDKDKNHFLLQLLPCSKYKDEIEEIRNLPDTTEKTKKVDVMIEKLYGEYSIKMIKLGDFGTHFSGSFAQGDAIGISKQYLNRGASAIICVAGPQSLDTAQEIMNQNKSCIVIGVDCAMENGDYQKPFKNSAFRDKTPKAKDGSESAQAGNILKFSAVKDMTSVSDKILRLAATGKCWDITSESPWLSAAPIPAWSEEEVFPEDRLYIDKFDNSHFNVLGFKKDKGPKSGEKFRVLSIPTVIKEDGKEYTIESIMPGKAGITDVEPFSDANLFNFDTLKIRNTEGIKETITFADKAFNFTSAGFTYIDLREVDCMHINSGGTNPKPFGEMGAIGTKTAKRGIIKLGFADTDNSAKVAYNCLLGQNKNWPRTEADPSRSICTFGFKTCGNIENGLISISWDGWPLLVDCLRHLSSVGAMVLDKSFFMQWHEQVEEYKTFCDKQTPKIELPNEFWGAVDPGVDGKNWSKLYTFNRESILHQYYSHVMTILGWTLKQASLSFPKSMTIQLDAAGVPHEIETPHIDMSILEWLRQNMYFIV